MNNIFTMKLKTYIQLLLLIAGISMVSCTKDDYAKTIEGSDTDVRITLFTPGTSVPKNMPKAAVDAETNVSRVKLLVFKLKGSSYEYQYWVDGEQITPVTNSDASVTFTAKLTSSTEPLKLILISNYHDAFDGTDFLLGTPESTVRQSIIDSFEGSLLTELPMFGEIKLDNLDAEKINNISVTMLRSIARVDIVNSINPLFSENFKITEVYIYRANNKISLIPDETALPTDVLTVTKATVPTGTAFANRYSKTAVEGEENVTQLYVPEALPVTDTDKQRTGATCIVVGGLFGDETTPSFYKVNFNSGLGGHPFGQVLRNHKYVFEILQVSAKGWPTPDDAANNESTAIIATMQVWDEMTSEMYFSGNDNYLGISSRKVVLNYIKGSEKQLFLQATLPFKIQPVDSEGNELGSAISTVGESFENDFFKLTLDQVASDGTNIYRLNIISLKENKTSDSFTGYFKVFTDFWTFDVEVEQETYQGLFSKKIVNVLTITSLHGDLGTTDGTLVDTVSGGAMRKILENKAYFSPNGKVPIGGILVHDLMNETISSSDDESMYILSKMLLLVDVVHLPKNCTPSAIASKMINDWLFERKDRVLIMGTDNETTNENLKPYFDEYDGDGTWRDGSNSITAIATTYLEERSIPIYQGPFGDVSENTEMGYIVGGCGYHNGYDWDNITPLLLTKGGTDDDSRLTHGIDMTRGIFYCGESRITTSKGSAMSQQANTSGTISSEFDSFMANCWAWIVEKVVTGEL